MKALRTPGQPIIGVDVGGTKIAACIADPQGKILSHLQRSTAIGDPETTLDSIAAAAKELLAENRIALEDVPAIGFGIPGLVDAEKGIGIASVNLGWKNVLVRDGLEARLQVRCAIDNDVRTGAIGEARFGSARGLRDVVYLNIGTGVSAVILLDRKILNGMNGLAGEIGHAVQVPDGPLCKCGGHGCLEAVASGPGITARAIEKIRTGRRSALSANMADPSPALTTQDVYQAAAQNDPVACETLMEVGGMIALALQYLALAYDPNVIVIGGGVVQGSPQLFGIIQANLARLAADSWVFRKIYREDLVKVSSLGMYAGVLGAAALVAPDTDNEFNHPVENQRR